MAKKFKLRDDVETRDRKRDRNGWKAQRDAERRAKGKRKAFETGEKR
ncbi:hypothetical protein RPALISO_229 [Ruegeria phage RpAliso]|nr:hypothetical protein RPALISO_229 [Ruegeria phage RpAliso]